MPISPRRGRLRGEAPQVVVVELQRRGHLEGVHGDALRVHAAHDVADGAVLAGGVERLQHDEDAVRVLRRQPLLVLAQQLDAVRQELDALLLVQEPGLVAGVEVLRQRHPPARRDAQRLDELGDALCSQVCHVVTPSAREASPRRLARACQSTSVPNDDGGEGRSTLTPVMASSASCVRPETVCAGLSDRGRILPVPGPASRRSPARRRRVPA